MATLRLKDYRVQGFAVNEKLWVKGLGLVIELNVEIGLEWKKEKN